MLITVKFLMSKITMLSSKIIRNFPTVREYQMPLGPFMQV